MATMSVTSLVWLTACLIAVTLANFEVKMTTNPDQITPNLTTNLTINCSTVWNDTAAIRMPLSITIKKNSWHQQNNWTTVATINSIENKLSDPFKQNATLGGHLSSSNNGSFLSVHWSYPGAAMSGVYRCEMLGFDMNNLPMTFNDSETVSDHKASQTDTLQKIVQHDKQIAALQQQIQALQQPGQGSSGCGLFLHDQVVNGTLYLVSRPFMQNSAMAESICSMYRGYLVEFDLPEYLIIKGVLTNATSRVYYPDPIPHVLVGLTDEFSDGTWRFRAHPKTVFPSFQYWAPSHPTNSKTENCAVLQSASSWSMASVPCYNNEKHVNFMCEVPNGIPLNC